MPTATTILANTNDGEIGSTDADYSTARAGLGTFDVRTSEGTFRNGIRNSDIGASGYSLRESFFEFDVSGLPQNIRVNSATLSFWLDFIQSDINFIIEVRAFDWGPTLTTADWVPGDDLGALSLLSTFDTTQTTLDTTISDYFAFSGEDALAAAIEAAAGVGSVRVVAATDRFRAGTVPTATEDVYLSYADATGQEPKLDIVYEEFLSIPIVAGDDDGFYNPDTTFFTATAAALQFGNDAGGSRDTFLLVQNVTVPPGVELASARLRMQAEATRTDSVCNILIVAEDSDNPAAPTSVADAIGRPRTTAQQAWNNVEPFTFGNEYLSPDFALVLSEVFARPGWTSGNSVLLFLEDNGSDLDVRRRAASLEHASLEPVVLELTWTLVELAGDIDIITDWSGDLTVIPNVFLAGDIDIVTEWTGELQVIRNLELAGEMDIVTDWTGDLRVIRNIELAGDIDIQTTWTGKLIVAKPPVLDSGVEPATYQFRARASDTLDTLAVLTEYRSVSYELPMHRLGGFQVSVIFREDLLDWAQNEGVLEVIRDGETVFVGIVDDFDSSDDYNPDTGEGVLRGLDARAMLGWRDIYPPAGEEFDSQIGVTAQNAIRHYVENNFTNPTDPNRDIDGPLSGATFLIEAGSIGATVDREERYSNLLDVCMDIARSADIWFDVTVTSGGDYQLQFHAPNDKTAGESDAIVFSTALGTADSLEWFVNRRGYTNAVTVLGQRVGDHQTVYAATDIGNGSMYRRERILSSNVRTSATLTIEDATTWWTDFSEYPNDAASSSPGPPGWTRRWDIDNVVVNVRKSGFPSGTTGGSALLMTERSPSGGRFALSSDYPGIVSTPVEIHARGRFTAAHFNVMNLHLHGAGTGNLNEDGYGVFLHGDPLNDGTDWSLASIVAGTGDAAIIRSTPVININAWYRMRLRREGRLIQAKVWADGVTEPTTWQEFEDHSHDTGWMGPGRWPVSSGGSGNTWFDWVGFGWNGATAPSSLSETVTIGATIYTISEDMTVANNVKREQDAELLAINLAAAINAGNGAGTLYGTGTTAHPDVTAIADGNKLTVVAKGGTTTIALSAGIHNGTWDIAELDLSPLVEIAQTALAEGADRIRSYRVMANRRTVPYRTAVDLGDIVTVRNSSLNLTDDRLVRAVKVDVNPNVGEQVQLELGELPLNLLDLVQRGDREVSALQRG